MRGLGLRGAPPEALPQLALLGLACGLAAGALMIVFRAAVEGAQSLFLPGGNPENYEALGAAARFLVPLAGGLAVGALFQWLPASARDVGPAHVIDALTRSSARLPLANALAQWVGASLSIVAGHSVGREGPAIHLGAACGSLGGQRLAAPEATLHVLVACGVAAAIAASFNTPLAGVVFAMEVIVTEYSVAGFAPVILAAVSATGLTRLFYGADPAFQVPELALRSLWELPYIVGVGAVIGVLASAFTRLLTFFAARAARLPFWAGAALGGLAVGLCALAAPEVMGIGYDTVNAALLGRLALATLASVAVLKLLATTAGVGLGLPGGLIGPMLVIGASAGGALGVAGAWLAPQYASTSGFYALLGMGAMMAGTLHAPLAALTAMLELTGNPNIIWPGMLAAIAAFGISRQLFGQRPVFDALLRARASDAGRGA
jgi:chloride channel protein, CIC family